MPIFIRFWERFGSRLGAEMAPKIVPEPLRNMPRNWLRKIFDFRPHFGTILHRFLIDFQDDFHVIDNQFSCLFAKRRKPIRLGKHNVLRLKLHLRKTDNQTKKQTKCSRRRPKSTSEKLFKKCPIRDQFWLYFGPQIRPNLTKNGCRIWVHLGIDF